MYLLTVNSQNMTPNDATTYETLDDLKTGIQETIKRYTDDDENSVQYTAWESVSRLRKAHIIHSKGYGITMGVFTRTDSENDLGEALTVNFDSTITEHFE